MRQVEIEYLEVDACPLCGAAGLDRAKLQRPSYFFGMYSMPLPGVGVSLRECVDCSLLYKSAVPSRYDLLKIMSASATSVWRPKRGPHPGVGWVTTYLNDRPRSVLDLGAANGDLLMELKPHASRIAALDVVEYPACRSVVNDDYIIGEIDGNLSRMAGKFEIVTAFDVFEHFLDVSAALDNVSALVAEGGKLIVETGDWKCIDGDPGDWYYANLFEHQIFWCRRSFEFLCDKYGFEQIEYRNCIHKGRRNLGFAKRIATALVVEFAKVRLFRLAMLGAGKGDPSRFAPPSLVDHAFVVLEKTCA
jgi:hypothetical protein